VTPMHALLLSVALFAPTADPVAKTPPEGVLPLGADGKPLNLDFETGTLKDWTADGEAFKDQPIKGDTVFPRRSDMRSLHQGQFWIGGFEKKGDKPTGTLTSVPFKVTHPWATFLVGGGPYEKETCVEVVDGATKDVIFRAAGTESESLSRVAVDLTKLAGKDIFVRVVDKHTGHWGHVNFDDFRFHSDKPKVTPRAVTKADDYKFSGQTPADAARNMTVPPGFTVSLFAGEPDLHQPIAFCFDDRGRLWVVEAYVYPRRNPAKGPLLPEAERKNGDKILIFEDTDGDGKFDKKTVFMEGLNLVSGIEYGFGGLWVGAAPYFLFIPIDAKTDKPAGEPQILLDGWGYQDTHETLNSFIWGPDGWLYGCHGVFTHSRVGKPGTPDKDRTPINAGVWRYHPTKHTFEVFCHGTSNPWGLDYNQYGDFFIEACVIPHLWHMVQGGRYERQGGQHFNPYTYDDIKTIAKHRHYVGDTPHGGNNRSDSAGGGHAHSGLICYQGGLWPKEYHGKLFMGNIHGHRINVDEIKPKGSSYEGDRNPDFLLSHDRYCIIVAIHTGPDGNVYFCDWSDKQVCHTPQEVWDRTNGRLFKISHKDTKPVKDLDLQKLTDAELVKLVPSDNEWMSRHARRILQERYGGEMKASAEVATALEELATKHQDPAKRLRGLWALHVTGGSANHYVSVIGDQSDQMRAWGVQLLLEAGTPDRSAIDRLTALARTDTSPVVRRAILSAAQRIPNARDRRDPVYEILHRADRSDQTLQLLGWYALESMVTTDLNSAFNVAFETNSPQIFAFAMRRFGAVGTPAAVGELTDMLRSGKEFNSPEQQLAILRGLQESVKGKRTADAPKGWADAYGKLRQSNNAEVRQTALSLAVTFGDAAAMDSLRKTLTDASAAAPARQAALAALLDVRDKQLPAVLQGLLADAAVRSAAVRGLAAFDDPKTPAALFAAYGSFTPVEKRDAVATLASRSAFAKELLAAVGEKKIPSTDIPAEIVRQLRNLNDEGVSKQIATVWGVVRDTPADRKKLIADWSRKMNPDVLAKADLGAGRAVFNKVCAQCHTLYGVGGKVGPEITGANRADLNYLLENIFDPSAVIPKEYAATKIDLADGRVVTGIIKEETAATLTVVTANETLTIPVKDVDKRTPSELSMMPDDLTKQATEPQIRNLLAYLKHTQQVPTLATAENVKDFFNGKDLTGWDGDKDVWSVENGEIVGKTAKGLKNNTFLKSTMDVTDFKLSVKVKLTPNEGNSGIQFRSVPIDGGEMRGAQADIGKGWWGKLYEESARGLLVKEGGEKYVKVNDWNEYVVEAWGGHVRISINGNICCDYHNDDLLARRGLIAFQVHSGGPTEVRFKDIKLEVIEKK
jgi:putative membrane-bound dehydrogenase-like protein